MVKVVLFLLGVLLSGCLWESPNFQELDYLPLDDSEFPYAGLPRLVIETKDFKEIRNRETEHEAFFQIYGKERAETEIFKLKIRGRGHSSFLFPKFSYRLKFEEKISLFGMPENKDWILLSNFADKSMLKNKLTFCLAKKLNAPYVPRSEFVELYVNREYLGVYQLTEKIEVAKNRVNIPERSGAFLIEIDNKYSRKDSVLFTPFFDIPLHIHEGEHSLLKDKKALKDFVGEFESYLLNEMSYSEKELSKWLDLESYFRVYWIQEFSRNVDGFLNSTYFTWVSNTPMQFGPVWDFDIAYGGAHEINPEGWYTRNYSWNKELFSDVDFQKKANHYWIENKNIFAEILDSLSFWELELKEPAKNNFKRWPVLESTESWAHRESFHSYLEAVESLRNWLRIRMKWINKNLS